MRRQCFEQVGPTDGPRQRTARAGVVHEHASSSYSDFAHLLIRVVRRRRGRNRKANRGRRRWHNHAGPQQRGETRAAPRRARGIGLWRRRRRRWRIRGWKRKMRRCRCPRRKRRRWRGRRTPVVAHAPSWEWRSMTFSACGGKTREPRCGG